MILLDSPRTLVVFKDMFFEYLDALTHFQRLFSTQIYTKRGMFQYPCYTRARSYPFVLRSRNFINRVEVWLKRAYLAKRWLEYDCN